jgi:hypothetical protein
VAKSAEFILDPDSNQLLALEPFGVLFATLLQQFSTKQSLQTVECSNTTELISMSRQLQVCVVIAYCPKASEAQRYLDLLKALQAEILAKRIRVIISVGADFMDLKQRFFQAGASEVVLESTAEKSFSGKVEHALSLLPTRKSLAPKKPSKDPSRASSGLGASSGASVKWVAPLEIESDCWLAVKENIKSVAGKWIVPLIGPSPRFGQWCAKNPSTGETGEWEWVPTQLLDDPFIREEGAWVFNGRRPEFQGGTWIFIGANAELYFLYKGESYGSKFSANTSEKDVLVIAEDSSQARAAAGLMERSGKPVRTSPAGTETGKQVEEAPVIEVQKPFSVTEALTLASDCFSREERIPRFMNGNWVMKLSAPTPAHGKWEIVRREEAEDAIWQWVPKSSDTFVVDVGTWIFQGNQPHFKDGLWAFVGKKPRLEFVTNVDPTLGRTVARRFSIDSRGLFVIAEDSTASTSALEKLQTLRKKPAAYLKRAAYGKSPTPVEKALFADSPLHPFVAAFFISEMMDAAGTSDSSKIEGILEKYCELISRYHSDTTVEAWILDEGKWRCLQHEDLMDFSLLQKADSAPTAGPMFQVKMLDVGGTKAALAMSGFKKVGLLVFSSPRTFNDPTGEFEAYARACSGLWIALAEASSGQDEMPEMPILESA